jgi:hypothetical protein
MSKPSSSAAPSREIDVEEVAKLVAEIDEMILATRQKVTRALTLSQTPDRRRALASLDASLSAPIRFSRALVST